MLYQIILTVAGIRKTRGTKINSQFLIISEVNINYETNRNTNYLCKRVEKRETKEVKTGKKGEKQQNVKVVTIFGITLKKSINNKRKKR